MKRSSTAEALDVNLSSANAEGLVRALRRMTTSAKPLGSVLAVRLNLCHPDLWNIGPGHDSEWAGASLTQAALGVISGACMHAKVRPSQSGCLGAGAECSSSSRCSK